MRKTVAVLGALGAFVVSAASASAATVPVNSLTPPFGATNSSVRWTPQGVNYGVYADAGRAGGSLEYDGLNGQPASVLTRLGFTYQYNTSDENPLATPYLRVFFARDINADGADDDIILDPTFCATVAPTENEDHTITTPPATVRLNDDACGAGAVQRTLADAIAAEGADAPISGIFVTQGFSGGQDASAYVRNLIVNADTFAFNVPPASPPGPAGPAVPAGPAGTTTIVQPPPAVPVNQVLGTQATQNCRGNTLRTLHAPNRKGERFLRVAAALQTANGFRSLKVNGRAIVVDLRNRPEANYNVRLISRYRTHSGKVRRVVTRRNLSVACS
jgi:hypothetical protein